MINHDILAEQNVLGSIMLNQVLALSVLTKLKTFMFYEKEHRVCFEAIKVLYEKNHPFSAMDVSSYLSTKEPEWGALLDASDVIGMTFNCPSSSNILSYAQKVIVCWQKRRSIELLEVFSQKMIEGSPEENEALRTHLKEELEKLVEGNENEFVADDNLADDRIEYYERLHRGEVEAIQMSTGIKSIDKLTFGLHKQNLIVLAARPAMGKTALALTIARHVAKQGKKVAFICLEMSEEETMDRMIAQEALVDSFKMKAGSCSSEERARLREAAQNLKSVKFFIWKNTSNGVKTLKSQLKMMQLRKGVDFLVADHIGLFDSESGGQRQQVHEVGEITKQLKLIAVDLDIPVLALCQLSRAVESRPDKVPILSDLRDSGNIEEHANTVFMLMRPSYYADKDEGIDEKLAILYVRKQRSGMTGEIPLDYHGSYTLFTDRS